MKMSENQTSGSFEENMYIIEDSHEQKVNKIIGDMLQVKIHILKHNLFGIQFLKSAIKDVFI